ncbi:helix-turn-helix domain-containing protein [Ferruginivarius sediminum]|uniref:helix-turn-helix domain-containing protein n=1 Tax=Ferruginivarius sediminum TaxID=2661937 RepID=UPI0011C07270|nr:helix-turn-helix transcriptional regulator [Ferruginivarius sediminum]
MSSRSLLPCCGEKLLRTYPGIDEIVWDGFAHRFREVANMNPPLPGNTVTLPLVDGLPVTALSSGLCERLCHSCSAAKTVNQVCMRRCHGHAQTFRNFFGLVNMSLRSDDAQRSVRQNVGMAPDTESRHRREIGRRIRQTREALGYSSRPAFLRDLLAQQHVDYERDRLEKWEAGKAEPSTRFLRDLRRWRGITSDWILFGDPSGLPQDVYEAVLKIERRAG